MSSWVAEEVRGSKLQDARLKQRLVLMVERLAARPEASIPQAMESCAETKAAYRFLDSARVTPEAIRAGYVQSCAQRVGTLAKVLIIQDTTTLDFTHHPETKGLGYLGNPNKRGMLVHTSLACTTEGVPLGILAQDAWIRELEEMGKTGDRRKRSPLDKESNKWIKALRVSNSIVLGSVETVTIGDSEADVFELFVAERPAKSQLLIRMGQNRRVEGEARYLWETVAATPVRGEISVELEAREKSTARTARCRIRYSPVLVRPPRHQSPGLCRKEPVALQAILVSEEEAPEGVEALRWLLVTTLRVESFADALQCVKWYGLRWLVERYHLVLKSGCRIERLQLETGERIERALAVYSVVAWRLLWLTYEARQSPDSPCDTALETHEWEALYCTIHKTPIPPSQPPTLKQATRWIAQLGGFQGRKGDGDPGVMVLWRGLRRLEDIADTWLLIRQPEDVGNG